MPLIWAGRAAKESRGGASAAPGRGLFSRRVREFLARSRGRGAGAYFLMSVAVWVTAWPAAETSLPTPATVLQLATSRAEAAAANTISLRMRNSPEPVTDFYDATR